MHLQLHVVLAIQLEHIHIPGHRLAVQGAALRQGQLVCLLLRISAQPGDIVEVAALDLAVVLLHLFIGTALNGAAVLQHLLIDAALNGAGVQLCIGVTAVQNADAGGRAGADPKLALLNRAIQQIHGGTACIAKEHIAAHGAVQNVLCRCICSAGNVQSRASIVAPAGAGRCLGQTVSAKLDLDDLI